MTQHTPNGTEGAGSASSRSIAGRYQVLGELGGGGVAVVYQVLERALPPAVRAGRRDKLQIAQQLGDPNSTVGRSYAADMCRVAQCATHCR